MSIGPAADALIRSLDAFWDGLRDRLPKRDRARDVFLASVVVLYLAVDAARRALDAGIAKIHPSGISGVSTNSLHDGPGAVRKAFDTWAGGYQRLAKLLGHTPVSLAIAQTLLELILVPLAFLVWYGVVKAVRRRVRRTQIDTLLAFSALGIVAYAVLGVFNQLVELAVLVRERTIPVLDGTLHLTGRFRSLLLPLFVIPIVIGAIQIQHEKKPAERLRRWRSAGTTYRVLLAVAALHAVLLLVSIPGAQTADALRLWLESPRLAFAGLLFTSILSLALATIAFRLGTDANPRRVVLGSAGTTRLLLAGAVLLVVGVVARSGPLALHRQAWGAGVLGAGLIVLVVALLSLPLAPGAGPAPPGSPAGTDGARPGGEPIAEPTEDAKRLVPAILALVPLTAVTLAMTRASMPTIMDSQSSGWLILYAGAAAVLAIAGFTVARGVTPWMFDPANKDTRRRLFIRVDVALAVVCAVVYALAIGNPWEWGNALGLTAIVASFLTAVVVVFGTLGYLMESRPLPAALDFVGFRRLPVILSLIVWGLVSHSVTKGGYHDLKTMPDTTVPTHSQLAVETAFQRWISANLSGASETAVPAADRPATPMVFIAAAGGGIKAAAFTAATVDCLLLGGTDTATTDSYGVPAAPRHPCVTGDAWPRLFAASGASGGSVGIASVLAERARGPVTDTWVSDRLGKDLLSPELAWQMFVEVPNAVLSFNPGLDRGEVLQDSWRREFADAAADPGGAPFYTDTSNPPDPGPLVFFSGTNLNDGCRVNISAARSVERTSQAYTVDPQLLPPGATRRGACNEQRALLGGVAPDQAGTRDLVDYLCNRNIDLATAAFLSARFPEVSPTGTIRCRDDDPETADSLSIGDAGYRDNSGAGSIMDTWGVLEPLVASYNASHDRCIVPIFVEINNGYAGYSGPSPSTDVAQLLAPVLGATKVFSDLSYGPIEQAAADFSRPLSPNLRAAAGGEVLRTRFFRISLVDHPGVTAPLGWSLSRDAVDDLVGQLDLPENKSALDSLRTLLDTGPSGAALTCQAA